MPYPTPWSFWTLQARNPDSHILERGNIAGNATPMGSLLCDVISRRIRMLWDMVPLTGVQSEILLRPEMETAKRFKLPGRWLAGAFCWEIHELTISPASPSRCAYFSGFWHFHCEPACTHCRVRYYLELLLYTRQNLVSQAAPAWKLDLITS